MRAATRQARVGVAVSKIRMSIQICSARPSRGKVSDYDEQKTAEAHSLGSDFIPFILEGNRNNSLSYEFLLGVRAETAPGVHNLSLEMEPIFYLSQSIPIGGDMELGTA